MVSAHPDDIEAATGGTVAQLTSQGTSVRYVIFTNGDKGCSSLACLNSTSEQIATMRAAEAKAAATVLGLAGTDVRLLGYEDSMLTSYSETDLRKALIAEIRSWKPHVLMSWFPLPRFELRPSLGWLDLGYHMDHQHSAQICMAAHMQAGLSRLFPEAGAAWSPLAYYLWEFVSPSHYVDISSTLNKKISAWQEHKSQYPAKELVAAELTWLAEAVANNTAGFKGRAAEGFLLFS